MSSKIDGKSGHASRKNSGIIVLKSFFGKEGNKFQKDENIKL